MINHMKIRRPGDWPTLGSDSVTGTNPNFISIEFTERILKSMKSTHTENKL